MTEHVLLTAQSTATSSLALTFDTYEQRACLTDQMDRGLETAVLGLFGETGSLLAVLKKKRRDNFAFAGYEAALREELGDLLWYFAAVARRANLSLEALASPDLPFAEGDSGAVVRTFREGMKSVTGAPDLTSTMIELAARVGDLVEDLRTNELAANRDIVSGRLKAIFVAVAKTAAAASVDLEEAALHNLQKIEARWASPENRIYRALSDSDMLEHERFPRKFDIAVREHTVNEKTYVIQSMNGVIIGDRLTDNKSESDDYRFHDVFHMAYAVHLGWSPVLRALFKVKRKGHPHLDENQDGARAILIEEGIATLVFNRALENNLYEGLTRVDPDLLKLIQEFIRGYEPEECNIWQWEQAILDGLKVFRQLRQHRAGTISADLDGHTLTFSLLPLPSELGNAASRV